MGYRVVVALAMTVLAAGLWADVAEAQRFGRNKVQYRAFDFEIIETKHFDIYFYEEMRPAALDAARMAERAYARLSRVLQHEFRERKPIIFYASHTDFQQTNVLPMFIDEGTGGVAEPMRNRIIMPMTGSYSNFEHVLIHELVHAFQFDIIYSRGGFTEGNPFSGRPPLWFMEGMAEYLAAGEIDTHTKAWLRDATLSGYMRDISEMSRRDDFLSYRFGQSLWAYIGSKWGDEVIGILLQRAPRLGLARAFQNTLGISLEELSREWLADVRSSYLPEVAELERPAAFAQRVTDRERLGDPSYLAPAISPDGNVMAYISQRDGFFPDLWLADARTGEVKRKLIEAARHADFESLRYLTSSAAFAPDGRSLAFTSQSAGREVLHIYDLTRNRVARTLRFELNGLRNPSWSPDGRQIVFSGNFGGITDLYLTDLDGNVRRLTNDRFAALLPAWSPDGRAIAFTTDRGPDTDFDRLAIGNLRTALYHLDTDRIEVLPHQDEGRNSNPVWSPDARSLAWVSDRSGTSNLVLYDFEDEHLYQISNVLSGITGIVPLSPALSWAAADGRLLFVYFEEAGYNIYAVGDPRTLPRARVSEPETPLVAVAVDLTPPQAGEPRSSASEIGDNGAIDASADAGTDAVDASPGEGTDAVDASPGVGADAVDASPGEGADAADAAPDVGADVIDAAPGASADTTESAQQQGMIASYYRDSEGFRPSAVVPDRARPGAPLSILALMEDPEYALPDTADFEIKSYRARLSPDLIGRPTIGAQVGGHYGSGMYGGSFISLSDILGNHNLLVAGQVNGSFSDAMFMGAYQNLRNRYNWGVAGQQVPLYRYVTGGQFPLDVDGEVRPVAAHVLLRDVYRIGQGMVSYPFSTFRRIEVGMSGIIFQRDLMYRGYFLDSGQLLDRDDRIFSMSYLEPSVSLVFDNSLFGWTGPIDGRRYRFTVSKPLGDISYTEGMVDFRNYINFRQKVVFATRFLGLVRQGSDGDRFSHFWGGPYFLRGYDGGSFRLGGEECAAMVSSVSRCPAADQLIGSNAAIMNMELRFPVIQELRLGPIGNFPPVDALVFFDGGLAWNSSICPAGGLVECTPEQEQDVRIVWRRSEGDDPVLVRQPLFSYGAGIRFNIFFAVLRFDYAIPLNRPDRSGVFSFSIGPSF